MALPVMEQPMGFQLGSRPVLPLPPPTLLSPVSERALGAAYRTCITCSDQGVIFRIVRVASDGSALAEATDGRCEEIRVDLIDAVAPGDVVLAHAGIALVRIRREQPRP